MKGGNYMNKERKFKTDFLFSTSSFIAGIGSIFNISGNYFDFNYSQSGHEADAKAIFSDWGMVGNDIITACNKSKKKYTY